MARRPIAKLSVTLLAAALAIAFAGCFPKTGAAPGPLANETVAVAKTRWADSTPEALEQGRQLFLKHCGECHGFPDVVAFPEDKWPAAAKRMGAKSKLSDADTELMTHFVLAWRSAATVPASSPAPAPANP
jgi:mono/diheme cytochrome c family protein